MTPMSVNPPDTREMRRSDGKIRPVFNPVIVVDTEIVSKRHDGLKASKHTIHAAQHQIGLRSLVLNPQL